MTTIPDLWRRGEARIRALGERLGRVATHRASRALAMILVGAVGGLVALALSPPVEGEVGPGRVELHARSAIEGRTELAVPPLGTISANTHNTPLLVRASVTSVDLTELQGLLVAERPTQAFVRQAEHDLGQLARKLAFAGLGAGIVGGAVAGLIASRIRWRRVALSTGGGLLAVSLLLGASWGNFNAAAMSEPSFAGPIERAPQVIETMSRHVGNLDNIRSRVDTLGREIAELYALSFSTDTDNAGTPETTILHVSDLHSNPLAMDVVIEIADNFGVDAVLDTGDLTSFGLRIESRITDQIGSLDMPYLFVPGNHDSEANRNAIAATPNVRVLRNDAVTINGLQILGIEDPTFTASNEVTTAEANEINLERSPEVADRVERVEPDVLAVHNPLIATDSMGLVPLVVNGHTHEREQEKVDGTLRLGVGSTGANGLESFTVDTDAPFEAQILRFSGPCLRYRDYLRVNGIGGDIEIDRETLRLRPSVVDGRLVCSRNPVG